MSANEIRDCPKCCGIETVRIYGVNDYELHASGKITSVLRGYCEKCGMSWSINI